MPIMQKINMPVMLNSGVTAVLVVLMVMAGVDFVKTSHIRGSFQAVVKAKFRSVGESIAYQSKHVAIGKRINNVLAFPCAPHQVFSPQYT